MSFPHHIKLALSPHFFTTASLEPIGSFIKKAAFKSTHTNRHKKRWIFLCYVLFPRSGVLIPEPLSVLAALIRICLNSMQSSSGSSMAIVLLNIASAAFREGHSRGARSLENARERTLNRSPRLTKASITMDEP